MDLLLNNDKNDFYVNFIKYLKNKSIDIWISKKEINLIIEELKLDNIYNFFLLNKKTFKTSFYDEHSKYIDYFINFIKELDLIKDYDSLINFIINNFEIDNNLSKFEIIKYLNIILYNYSCQIILNLFDKSLNNDDKLKKILDPFGFSEKILLSLIDEKN